MRFQKCEEFPQRVQTWHQLCQIRLKNLPVTTSPLDIQQQSTNSWKSTDKSLSWPVWPPILDKSHKDIYYRVILSRTFWPTFPHATPSGVVSHCTLQGKKLHFFLSPSTGHANICRAVLGLLSKQGPIQVPFHLWPQEGLWPPPPPRWDLTNQQWLPKCGKKTVLLKYKLSPGICSKRSKYPPTHNFEQISPSVWIKEER